MLNASFCGVYYITGEQAVELQDRNMVLHGNPVTQITWAYENRLKKIPAWLQTLEKVKKADLQYCDVKEMKGGAFPASLEELNIKNQMTGLRLHPDSFEGLSKLKWLEMSTNKLAEDDMHPGLFGDTKLVYLGIQSNPDMLNFDAAALFPGGSRRLQYWNCERCGLKSVGDDKTNFHGLSELREIILSFNPLTSIDVTSFDGLGELETLAIAQTSLTSLPAGVFSGLFNLKRLYLDENDFDWLPPRLFADLCR
jgi:Leucine-rich repeat (LRR) protein